MGRNCGTVGATMKLRKCLKSAIGLRRCGIFSGSDSDRGSVLSGLSTMKPSSPDGGCCPLGASGLAELDLVRLGKA